MDLVFPTLDHAIESVRDGGPLIPFLITEANGQRKLERFVAGTLEESLSRAEAAAAALPGSASAYGIAHDGFITVEGERFDAVLVEAAERSSSEALLFAQRYRPKKFLRKLATIDNAALIGDAPNRLVGAAR
jgi:hypothetical protein